MLEFNVTMASKATVAFDIGGSGKVTIYNKGTTTNVTSQQIFVCYDYVRCNVLTSTTVSAFVLAFVSVCVHTVPQYVR
jgi:hypothetical protein